MNNAPTKSDLYAMIDAAAVAAAEYKHEPATGMFAKFDDPEAGRKVAAREAAFAVLRDLLDARGVDLGDDFES